MMGSARNTDEEEVKMTTCADVMTKNLATCLPTDSVQEVARVMKEQNVGPIPVVQDRNSNRLAGIVTDRDFTLRVIAEGRDPSSTKVGDVMTSDPVKCRQDEDLQTALDSMSSHQVRRIPVVDDQGQLAGIVSQADVATRTETPAKVAEMVGKVSKSASASA